MSLSRNANKFSDKSKTNMLTTDTYHEGEGEVKSCSATESCTYAVTVSKKNSGSSEEGPLCIGQKSFISIHSTDQLCQICDANSVSNLDDCNLEVLSRNDVFPSTSEESLANDECLVQSNRNRSKNKSHKQKLQSDNAEKSLYMPTNSKSATGSRQREPDDGQQSSVYSDFDIHKNTLYVVGSNPGEPKKSYPDPPKKLTKAMKKFLRNIDKHKKENNSKGSDKAISKLTTIRGILKDGRFGPECTGDSSEQRGDDYSADDLLPFSIDFGVHNYKQNPDKSVTFNTKVVIIHFTGDLCMGQSVETLSKEKDQQARNSELRKTYLTKYNEFWPTQK